MPTCRDCGQEIIYVWRNGKLHPCDPEPASHYRNRRHIEAVRRRDDKPAKTKPVKAKPKVDTEVLDMLTAQWDEKRARALLPRIKGDTLEDKLRHAYRIVSEEG